MEKSLFVGQKWEVYCQRKKRGQIYGVLVKSEKSTGVCPVGKKRGWREAVAVHVFMCVSACACQRLALSGPGNVGWLCF